MFIGIICIFRTLYKQGPYGGKPVAKRILIITPGSLVKVRIMFYYFPCLLVTNNIGKKLLPNSLYFNL
jgi:hypothetical protein